MRYYLYPDGDAAENGEKAGGSGFLVGVSLSTLKQRVYVYAVTNKHVVEDAQSRTIRVNAQSGGVEILETNIDEWTRPVSDDLAVTWLPLDQSHLFRYIHTDRFITLEKINAYKIGPGDPVFLIGRFVNHEGRDSNTPAVRFGNIAMMPGQPVERQDGSLQDSFLVDMRSISGYSGSPAFTYIPAPELGFRRICHANEPRTDIGPWLLGVDWGHLQRVEDVVYRNGGKHPDGLCVSSNSGMAGIVPAWKLHDLLYSEGLQAERKELARSSTSNRRA